MGHRFSFYLYLYIFICVCENGVGVYASVLGKIEELVGKRMSVTVVLLPSVCVRVCSCVVR